MDKANQLLKILPDSLFIELAAFAWDARQRSFRIGDVANEIRKYLDQSDLLTEAAEHPDCYNTMEIYEAVSIMLNREFAPRSVRDFARIASLFPQTVRDEYDSLPFSHFRFSAQLPKPLDGLEISRAETLRRNGIPPPVAWLEHWFFSSSTPPPMPAEWSPAERDNLDYTNLDYTSADGSATVTTQERPKLRQFADSFEYLLDELGLPEIVYSSVLSLWRQIISILDGYRT